jgi:hypothetical protein
MQINVSLTDWKETLDRANSGTLADDLADDNPCVWARAPESWRSDSSIQFMNFEEAYSFIAPHLSAENRKTADESIGALFRMDAIYELDSAMECWFMAISPNTIKNILNNLAGVDFAPFRKLYDQHCPESIKSGLTDDDYQEDFYSYVIQWRDALV